jgi:glycosyltransferase involved in cell wall biosynthesis
MGSRKDNTIVIIPSFNEARTIGTLIRGLVPGGLDVLVIDDGSSDNTECEALDAGAMVIRNKTNLGKGASVRNGIQHVLDKTKYEWIVMMDGDGQHHPEDVPILMSETVKEDADIVVGNRMGETKNMPIVRRLTNTFMSWLLSKFCGQRIPDTQCGFRLMKADALRGLKLETDRFDIESEMLIEASMNGFKIRSAPVQTIYGDEESRIHPVRDTIKFIQLLAKYSTKKNALRRNAPKNGGNAVGGEGYRRP